MTSAPLRRASPAVASLPRPLRSPVHPHPRFKPGAGSSPLPLRERDATPLTAPLGSRLRGNDGVVRGNDVEGFAGMTLRVGFETRVYVASASLCERDVVVLRRKIVGSATSIGGYGVGGVAESFR